MRARVGTNASIQTVQYGESLRFNGVQVSLHPAGHVLGSAQVRVEYKGEVWVVSGDYKLDEDPTCPPFEPVRCHTFITESTFGLPVYRWQTPQAIFADVNAWWHANAQAGRASVIFAYAFGKAQRILMGVDASIGPVVCHGAVEQLNRAYRDADVLLPTTHTVQDGASIDISRALVIAPPSAQGTPWLKRFGDYRDAFASGWMAVRGAKKQRATDRGFILSDHADWPSLMTAIHATQAQRVLVTHGQVAVMVRHLRDLGLEADALETEFEGEAEPANELPTEEQAAI
jgi:putative mRNA 3-end processing factor